MRLLAGDVGGTKTALALYECVATDAYRLLAEGICAGADRASFGDVLRRFDIGLLGARAHAASLSNARGA